MNPFEMVVLIVGIVAVGKVLQARYTSGAAAGALSSAEADDMRGDIQKLKDRVAVLERLATDGSSSLEREIEKLRDRG